MIERGYYGRIEVRGEAPAASWPDWTDMDTWAPRDFPPIAGGSPEGDGEAMETTSFWSGGYETHASRGEIDAAAKADAQQLEKVKAEADAHVAAADAAAAYVEAYRANDRAHAALQRAQHALRKALGGCHWIDHRFGVRLVVGDHIIDDGSKPGRGYTVRRVRRVYHIARPAPEPAPLYSVHFFGELPVGSRFTFAENSERFVYEKTGDRTFRYFDLPHLPHLPVWPIAGPGVTVVHLGSPEPCDASSS